MVGSIVVVASSRALVRVSLIVMILSVICRIIWIRSILVRIALSRAIVLLTAYPAIASVALHRVMLLYLLIASVAPANPSSLATLQTHLALRGRSGAQLVLLRLYLH